MNRKEDLRVIKTRLNIKNTFVELLNEKDFSKITIQNIIDKAYINRSTFYKHYTDKYQLASQLIDEVERAAEAFLKERFHDKNGEDFISLLQKIYLYFYVQKKTILSLWKIKTETIHLYDDIEELLKKNFIQYLIEYQEQKDDSLLDYYASIYSSLVLTSLKWILKSGSETDIKKILNQYKKDYFWNMAFE